MLHIIIHNYIYFKLNNQIDGAQSFIDMVDSLKLDDLFSKIEEDDNLDLNLIATYYQIHLDEDTEELVNKSQYLALDIPWLNTWMYDINYGWTTLNYKLRDSLILLRDYIDYTEVESIDAKAKMFKDFLFVHRDIFSIIPIHFKSIEEFLAYEDILHQIIYIDAYFYLLSYPNISEDELLLKQDIEKQIKANNLTKLPHDTKNLMALLQAFYNANNFDNLKEEYPEKKEYVRKLIQEKTNKVLLLDYC